MCQPEAQPVFFNMTEVKEKSLSNMQSQEDV